MIRKKRNRRSGGFLEAFLGTSLIAWILYAMAFLIPGCGDGGGTPTPVVLLDAQLTGGQEVPGVDTEATGEGLFTLHRDTNRLEWHVEFRDLSSSQTGAHIHGPAGHGQNAAILQHLPNGSPSVGVWRYPEDLEDDILGNRTYINVHTQNHLDGEIRGQIIARPY